MPNEQVIEKVKTIKDYFFTGMNLEKNLPLIEKETTTIIKKISSQAVIKDHTFVGIEIEVENIEEVPSYLRLWSTVKDGSLRNNGREFVSLPIPASTASIALEWLKHRLEIKNNPEFTNRTSVHVHVNVSDMTKNQVKSFILTYLLFERVLYEFAGGNRFNNIFCVPLSHAGYYKTLNYLFTFDKYDDDRFIYQLSDQWHKYTGCNLKTITDKGTIEFRHLPGTLDVEKISVWIGMILKMKEYSSSKDTKKLFEEIAELNTNSSYDMMLSKVFGEYSYYLQFRNLHKLMEKDVTHIKRCFISYERNKFSLEKFKESKLGKWVYRKENVIVDNYSDLSLKELIAIKDKLYKDYHKAKTAAEQNRIGKEYKVVTQLIDKKSKGMF